MQKVYIIGGHITEGKREEGNIFTVPSNMVLDPLAAKTVIESNLDITLIPLKAQLKVTSFPAILETLQLSYGTPESILPVNYYRNCPGYKKSTRHAASW